MANHAAAVTPSDTVTLPSGSAWLSFANSGTQTLIIDTVGGEVGVSILLPSGMWPIRAAKVRATGTTVTSIVAYWD
jgi:hypothetical protein